MKIRTSEKSLKIAEIQRLLTEVCEYKNETKRQNYLTLVGIRNIIDDRLEEFKSVEKKDD